MLVKEVGGSKATLYKYFPSKDDLFVGIADQIVSRAPQDDPLANPDAPIEEALDAFGLAILRGVTGERAVVLFRIALGEYGRFPQLAESLWRTGPQETYRRFHEFIARREASGELEVENPQFAAEQFIAGIVGHIQLKVAMGEAEVPTEDEMHARVRSARETFLSRYRR